MTRQDLIEGILKALADKAPTAPSVLGKPRRREPDWRKMGEIIGGAYTGHILGGLLGVNVGPTAAQAPHVKRNQRASNELDKRMYPPENGDSRLSRKGVNLLDPKAFISGEHYKEKTPASTTWVHTPEQAQKIGLDKKDFSAIETRKSSPYMQSSDGANFSVVTPRKRYIARDVVAHEFGHVKDYQTNPPTPGEMMASIFGTASELPRERAAWDKSGVPQGSAMRRHALDTYRHAENAGKAATRGMQIGGSAGAAMGTAIGGLYAAKNVDNRRARNLQAARGRVNLLHTKPQIAREDIMTRQDLIEAILEAERYVPKAQLRKQKEYEQRKKERQERREKEKEENRKKYPGGTPWRKSRAAGWKEGDPWETSHAKKKDK